jgi:hypothetical protein
MKTKYQIKWAIDCLEHQKSMSQENRDQYYHGISKEECERKISSLRRDLSDKNYDRDGEIALDRSQIKSYAESLCGDVAKMVHRAACEELELSEEETSILDENLIILSRIDERIEKGEFNEEVNVRGNTVLRGFHENGSRYIYDQRLLGENSGWQQFDTNQDAEYFGVWINPNKRETFTYCEQDLIHVKCPSNSSYNREIRDLVEHYTQAPSCKTIGADGSVTEYYEDAPLLLPEDEVVKA